MEENSLTIQQNTEIVTYDEAVYDRDKMSGLMDEIVSSVKDHRLNTKRAISADIVSTVRIQNQYGQYVAACERELHRKDLPEELRQKIMDSMFEACKASEEAGVESRDFLIEQLNQSRRLPWELVGVMALIIAAGFGGKGIFHALKA